MSELYIGTSGYDYPEWKGLFYPEKTARAKFLEYYATQFNALELNGTYYKMPTQSQMVNMITRTGGRVKFSVKAFQDLTHCADKSNFIPLAKEFKTALEPMLAGNLLSCALFQFPQSFHYEKDQRVYLDLLMNELKDIPVVVEMRNTQWQNEKVYAALRERNIGWCITDNPSISNLPKLEYTATGDIAYMRFHGRNAETWYTGNNVSRYDYLYRDSELETFVNPIKELLRHTKIVLLFFNNHAKGQATINARKIIMLLS